MNEVAFLSAKCWDRRNIADLIKAVTPCHDAQVVGPYVNAAKSQIGKFVLHEQYLPHTGTYAVST